MWFLRISRTFVAFQNSLRIVAITLVSCTTGMGEQAVMVKEEQPEDLSLRTREVMVMIVIIVIMVMVMMVIMVKKVMVDRVMVMDRGCDEAGIGERGPQRGVSTCVS